MQSLTILLLTTDIKIETLYQEKLSDLGHTMHLVRTQSQAQRHLNQHTITVLLLDVGLNKRSRLDLLTQFQMMAEVPPIIALTQIRDDAINQETIMLLGVQDYLIVGEHSLSELQLGLQKAVARHHHQQERDQQLAQKVAKRAKRFALLSDITQTAVTELESQEMLQTLLSQVAAIFDAEASYCLLWNDRNHRHYITAKYGKVTEDTYMQSAYILLAKVALHTNHPTLIDTPAKAPYLHTNMANQLTAKAILILPLVVDKQRLGALALSFEKPQQLSDEALSLGEQAARQVGLALVKAQLWQETKKRATRMERLYQISSDLRTASDVDTILATTLKNAIYVSHSICSILLMPPNEGDLLKDDFAWPSDDEVANWADNPLTQHAYLLRQGHLVQEDIQNVYHLQNMNHHLALPLRTQDKLIGMLHVSIVDTKRELLRSEMGILTTLADIAGSALYRIMALETLEQRVQSRTQALAEANERLQQMDNIRSKFVSDMSHELRTPVTNFRLYLDLLENGRSERFTHYLGVLKHETQRLERLITETLNMSRLDTHKEQLVISDIHLNELVAIVAANHLHTVDSAGLMLEFQPDESLPAIQGVRDQLLQAIAKLLDNAIRYTPQGGSILLITAVSENGRFAQLYVQDTGMGINPNEQQHLFERFYRGDRTSQSNLPGAGLGLAFVKEIAELHRGSITVKSELDQGATFCLSLPIL